ncbi:hypothetical protein CU633_04625 [Bacillus sp. V3-13]|nr:hypothetical protein CU633_04625 [Bacillus sp. V3-13]
MEDWTKRYNELKKLLMEYIKNWVIGWQLFIRKEFKRAGKLKPAHSTCCDLYDFSCSTSIPL